VSGYALHLCDAVKNSRETSLNLGMGLAGGSEALICAVSLLKNVS
jgi:hypothetical protein